MSVINFVCTVIVNLLAQLHQVHVEVPRVPTWKCGTCHCLPGTLYTECVVCNTDSTQGLRLSGPQANFSAPGGIYPQPSTFPKVSELVFTTFVSIVFTMFTLRRTDVRLRPMATLRVIMRLPMAMFRLMMIPPRVMVWLLRALWQGSRRFIWHIFSSPVALKDTVAAPNAVVSARCAAASARLATVNPILRNRISFLVKYNNILNNRILFLVNKEPQWKKELVSPMLKMELEKNKVHRENQRLRELITSLRKKSKHQNTQHIIDRNLWYKLWKWELEKHNKECLLIAKEALIKLQCEYDDVLKMVKTCPITHDPMKDPVICIRDGHRYEREPITEWIKQNGTSPMTRKAVSLDDLIPDTPGAILKAIASKEVCE